MSEHCAVALNGTHALLAGERGSGGFGSSVAYIYNTVTEEFTSKLIFIYNVGKLNRNIYVWKHNSSIT